MIRNIVRKHKSKVAAVVAAGAALAPAARAADPTSLEGFSTVATGYITTGTGVAISAGVLSLGWVAFRIVRKYASKA